MANLTAPYLRTPYEKQLHVRTASSLHGKSFYEEHPLIRFDTLHERQVYLIFAAFCSHNPIREEKDVFRYCDYTDLSDETVFDTFMRNVLSEALYNTGVRSRFSEGILILSTCSYHLKDGRFVVAAVRTTPKNEQGSLRSPDIFGIADRPEKEDNTNRRFTV
ncbi:MAG: class B sortase [Clostridia bacterium]|nr:class B sortase [Clostridia bacterium]